MLAAQFGFPDFRHAVRRYYLRSRASTSIHGPLGADDASSVLSPPLTAAAIVWGLLRTASVGVSAYHGYKRNGDSLGWGVGWGALASLFGVFVPAIALAQGLGKRKHA